jgi:hypothetical protein
MEGACQSNNGIAKNDCSVNQREKKRQRYLIFLARLTATKVPGRKSVVRKAIIFIAELSRLLAAASSLESLERPMLISVSACAMRLNSYGENV